jgi:tetratricopeptide (TPR) repeat protein
VLARAAASVARAVREAADLSDAWLAQGWYLYITTLLGSNHDMPGARRALERSIALDPNSPEAHSQLGSLVTQMGEDSLGASELRRSLVLEPGRAVTFADLAVLEMYRHRYADAVRWADSAIAADQRFARGWIYRALARLMAGDTAGAVSDANRAVGLGGDGTGAVRAAHAVVRAAVGDTAAARAEADDVVAHGNTALMVSPFVILGDRRRALDVLEGLPAQGMRCVARLWPMVAPLRGDPRFERLTADCSWR